MMSGRPAARQRTGSACTTSLPRPCRRAQALRLGAILALGAAIVGLAADDLAGSRAGVAGGDVADQDVLSGRVADGDHRAARIEAEQQIAAARPRAEAHRALPAPTSV
jgi:hypothetical protein